MRLEVGALRDVIAVKRLVVIDAEQTLRVNGRPPHRSRDGSRVYLRSSKGKEPVDDHRTLLDLARRGGDAEVQARERRTTLNLIPDALSPADVEQYVRASDTQYLRVNAHAAPLTVTPEFADWPM